MRKIKLFLYGVFYHRRIIRKLKEELAKPYELRLMELKADMDGITATFEHPLIQTFCQAMIASFKGMEGAKNYVALRFAGDGEMWEFVLQRVFGQTPSELVAAQRKEIEELKNKLEQWERSSS